jgi:hypothetical protein
MIQGLEDEEATAGFGIWDRQFESRVGKWCSEVARCAWLEGEVHSRWINICLRRPYLCAFNIPKSCQ